LELKQLSLAGQIWSESWPEVGGGGGRSQGPGGPAYAGEGGGPGGAGATKHQPQVRGLSKHQRPVRGYPTLTSGQRLTTPTSGQEQFNVKLSSWLPIVHNTNL
jgi:hypothetical protein